MPPLMEEEEHKKDYRPKVVSIGPYFHGESEFAFVQNFKSTAVELFISGGQKDEQFYLQKVLEIIREIRNCYEQISVPDDYLAGMMLRDAALIIIFMEIYELPRGNPSTTLQHKLCKMKERLGMLMVSILARDLFLLQNQIPLRVIKLLIYLRYGPGKDEELLQRFLNKIFQTENRQKEKISLKEEADRPEPLHLLEASHRLIVSDFVGPPTDHNESRPLKFLFPKACKANYAAKIERKELYSHRTVMDLRAKGILFKPITNEASKSVNFKFHIIYARVELPSWAISAHTTALLRNMVAYELSPNSPAESEVISYINFMKSLIDGPDDVKELRERKVLSNMLSSDQEAADIFNHIDTYGVDNVELFGQVKQQIQQHCNSRINTWVAELLHSYFRSPWTFSAFVAAFGVLGISVAQLYYAVHPPPDS